MFANILYIVFHKSISQDRMHLNELVAANSINCLETIQFA